MSIYSDLIERFAEDGLSSAQQAEIDAIRLATRFGDDDTLWGVILPMYFLSNRREQARVDQEALLRAIQNVSTGGIDAEKLGKLVARHIDASEIEVAAPEVDTGRVAKALAKSATPELVQAVEASLESRVVKLDAEAVNAAVKTAVSDSLFSWQVAAGAAVALLLVVAAYWWGGHQMEAQYRPLVQQLQAQVQADQPHQRR
jgi:hypothetical protein